MGSWVKHSTHRWVRLARQVDVRGQQRHGRREGPDVQVVHLLHTRYLLTATQDNVSLAEHRTAVSAAKNVCMLTLCAASSTITQHAQIHGERKVVDQE